MCVYLIHFDTPYKQAKHYIGFANNLNARLEHHANGTGARLMQVIKQNNISWRLARTWDEGDKALERRIKNRKEAPTLCPICNPNAARLANY